VLDDVGRWPVDETIVVLGSEADEVESACDLTQVSVVVDPEWAEGMASPLRAVLDLVSRDRRVTHVVLARGDQPGVPPDVVGALVDHARSSEAPAVVPKYRYATGWPVIVERSLWDVFLRLEGPIDVHHILATHARAIEEVWVDRLAPRRIETGRDLPGSRR
jgi:molybdenum cofactor cytidylyltransferase